MSRWKYVEGDLENKEVDIWNMIEEKEMRFIRNIIWDWLDKNQIELSDDAELQIRLYDNPKANKKVSYQ
tara:strand:- start:1265 stop:1471 length:207 start_codon:yes stop_codon:yes gene_type:complete